MDTDREAKTEKKYPPDVEEDTVKDDPDEEWDDEEDVATEDADEERDGETEETSPAPVRPRSRPDAGAVGCLALVLAVVLLFGWLTVSVIVDLAKENREAELRRWRAEETYRRSVAQRSSSGGSSSGKSSSGGSSSYGSSGSTYKPKSTGGNNRKDEYNAADFGNPEDFYDEHYDDFFDYYDAEDYWNEYN